MPHRVAPVLGMHRSGTALLARMLQALGVDLGGPLRAPTADSPRGSWEHRFFLQVNQRLLSACGCDPSGIDRVEPLAAAPGAVTRLAPAMVGAIGAFLAHGFPGGTWSFKDPRTAVTFPFWRDVLARLQIEDVRPVVVLRSPRGCLHSLLRCQDVRRPVQTSHDRRLLLTLWSVYYELIEDHAPADSLWLLHQDVVSPDTASSSLSRCAEYLELRPAHLSPALAVIDPRLLHDPFDAWEPTGIPAIDDQYRRLRERARPRARKRTAGRMRSGVVPAAEAPRHCIYVVSPPGYRHSHAFDEVALAFHHALRDLHVRAPIVTEPYEITGTPIVLGAHLLSQEAAGMLPPASIVYNLEQVSAGSPWFSPAYLATLRRFALWDYSPQNLRALQDLGIRHGELCELGYHGALETLSRLPAAKQDIDVLFYGSLNPRRGEILRRLSEAGLGVVHLFGIYGAARDRYIQRAKVVLSVHYDEAHVLEIVRIAHLLTNGCCVVAEAGRAPELAPAVRAGVCLADYAGLVHACRALVASAPRREALAATAREHFMQRPLAANLARLLGRPAARERRAVPFSR